MVAQASSYCAHACSPSHNPRAQKVTQTRHALETNRAGVFAIGDVRSESVKRFAAAVGEGAQVVSAIHAYLARSGSAAASTVAITRR